MDYSSYNWNSMATSDMSAQYQAEDLFFQGADLINQKQYARAKQTLEHAIEIDPTCGRAYNHLGWLFETQYRDYAKAEEMYKKALEHAPEYPAVYYNYSVTLSALKRYDELEALLKKAETVPGIGSDRLYNEWGILREDQGNFDEAISWYEKALANAKGMVDVESYQANIERCKKKKELLTKK